MPDQDYYTILTDTGRAELAAAMADDSPLGITEAALGDGGGASYDPSPDQTALVGEWHRRPINRITVDPANPHWVVVEVVVPMSVGGHYVREVGLIDSDGALIAIAKFPPTYKPTLIAGTGSDLVIRVILEVANADSVELLIDPTVVTASRAYVDQTVGAMAGDLTQAIETMRDEVEQSIGDLRAAREALAATMGDYRLAPIFPEIETGGGRLPVSAEHGGITTGAATLLHRGGRRFDLGTIADRNFPTAPNRTYHLRWLAPGQHNVEPTIWPAGRLVLRDLSDPAYNPHGRAEDHSVFDTGYDDALVARVVTGGANTPAVTPLINRATLTWNEQSAIYSNDPPFRNRFELITGSNSIRATIASAPYNWSRVPRLRSFGGVVGWGNLYAYEVQPATSGVANNMTLTEVNRYGAEIQGFSDYRGGDGPFHLSTDRIYIVGRFHFTA
ncbi:phage tail protein [Fodinicurvata sp. EGI_FJ10296]|uniref:phage tail protein n=1 Tax=Fodinicurvata sp. EGI_FJ10296 TaxID=3231908 RepID=UPI0034518C1A